MLQALPMPACLFDAEARCFVASNADFCRLVGYSDAELTALPWYKLLADEHIKLAEIAMALEAPEQAVAWRLKTKDGTPISVAAKGRRMKFIRDNGMAVDAFFLAVVKSDRDKEIVPAESIYRR